jgi:hypothetical protein
LSDPSEDVVKHDLQLLAQISSSSEDSYFRSFMVNVLELFSTDRRLLETRGSLIIRQLCLHLNAEKIFRTLAEILEKDDVSSSKEGNQQLTFQDLEFASMMVVKLNMILITSPELSDFRRRLKNLESKDGQMLFTSLYRSWCHNAVAAFALCLLAQAYEHASNVLQIFAELELTVPLLVQIDKLVMLIESPVFTNLRLQLLEPDKYPYLPKCLYGLLMILPQSSAFVSLRARLAVVNSSGYAPPPARPGYAAPTGRKSGKEEIKWQELLSRELVVAYQLTPRLPICAGAPRTHSPATTGCGPDREQHALFIPVPDVWVGWNGQAGPSRSPAPEAWGDGAGLGRQAYRLRPRIWLGTHRQRPVAAQSPSRRFWRGRRTRGRRRCRGQHAGRVKRRRAPDEPAAPPRGCPEALPRCPAWTAMMRCYRHKLCPPLKPFTIPVSATLIVPPPTDR